MKIEYYNKQYEIPNWVNYITTDKSGSIFAWEYMPEMHERSGQWLCSINHLNNDGKLKWLGRIGEKYIICDKFPQWGSSILGINDRFIYKEQDDNRATDNLTLGDVIRNAIKEEQDKDTIDNVRRCTIKSSEIHGDLELMWPQWEGYGND